MSQANVNSNAARSRKNAKDFSARNINTDDQKAGKSDVTESPTHEFRVRFAPYLQPKDALSLTETKQIDFDNEQRWKQNEQHVETINKIHKRMGIPDFKNNKPPNYFETAYARYLERINEPDFKTIEAVRWLYKNYKLLPFRNYDLDEAGAMADRKATEEYIKKRQDEYKTKRRTISLEDVTGATPEHARRCTCNLRWDGISNVCMGQQRPGVTKLRVAWRVNEEKHHFLHPCVEPYIY